MTDTHEKRTNSSSALNARCFGVEENNAIAFAHTKTVFGEIHQALEFVCRKTAETDFPVIVAFVVALPHDVVPAERSCLVLARRQQSARRHRFVNRHIRARPFGAKKLKLCGKGQPGDRTWCVKSGKVRLAVEIAKLF